MATTSSYLKYLPPVLWSSQPVAGPFDLGKMLCVFQKILTGIDDGVPITHGDNAVMTTVTQPVVGSPLPQSIRLTAGTGTKFLPGSSYTYNGATPEVINVTAVTANTITAVIRQNHAANQTIVNSSGTHRDIQDVIAGLVTLYGAWTTPPDYLDWLAQWVALQMDPVWDEYQRRSVLSQIVGIYSERGTKPGLDAFFDIYALAKQRPRVVVDDDSKILFCAPQPQLVVPVSTLVFQRPMIAPKYIALDGTGSLLVCDLGTSPDAPYSPALWRISAAGDYDYSPGPPSEPQPYQPASLSLSAPFAVAADGTNGGAYLIDLFTGYTLYRLTSPEVGAVTLSGAPTTGENAIITIGGNSYPLAQTGGFTLTQQAAAWVTSLNAAASFSAKYVASSSLGIITIAPLTGSPADDLTLVQTFGHVTLEVGSAGASGTITLSGVPTTGESSLITIEYGALPVSSYTLAETTGLTATQQAATWVTSLNGTPSFSTNYTASSVGAVLTISPLALISGERLLLTASSSSLQVTATGPRFGVSTDFADDSSIPPLGLVYPMAMVVNSAGHPLILDRGATPNLQSATAVVDVQIAAGPAYTGTAPHAFGTIVEPLSMVLRADGSLVVADAANQNAAAPADLIAIDTGTWTSTSLLSGMPAGSNPLVTPTGIVEVDSKHLMVVDAGLRPYIPDPAGPFNCLIAQQAAIYEVDLSVVPPVITRVSELKSLVYPRGMVGDGNGTLYVCDSGLPDLQSYKSRLWRSEPQQFSVVVHFQRNPGSPDFSIALSGTPTTGSQCSITLGSTQYNLAEVTGNTVAQQAEAWAAALNGNASFDALYTAVGLGNVICIYPAPGTNANGTSIAVGSSADMTLTQGLLAMTVALTGVPTGGENGVVNVGPPPGYFLAETGGDTTAQQATAWAATLNTSARFNQDFIALSSGNVIVILYKSTGFGYNLPAFVSSSPSLTLTATLPPFAVGTITLMGTPTTGESCQITVGLSAYTLAETSGFNVTGQAAAWCTTLNATPPFSGSYVANNSGGVINVFALKSLSSPALALAAVSSAHLSVVAYSELQNRQRFLQSIRDVVSDEIPAQARWYLQSELSTA